MSRNDSMRRAILSVCLIAHAGLLGYGALRHSPHVDEVAHLVAGLSHWEFGNFRLFNVNPPLVRLAAAFPVWLAEPAVDWSMFNDEPGSRAEFRIGQRFLDLNGYRSFWYFTVARWACIPFSVLGGLFCYYWARDLWGVDSGLVAAALWCFCPNVLAHGQTITPDVPAAAMGLAAAWRYWTWLARPNYSNALSAGLFLGLALDCKTTWVFLFGLWPILWVADRIGGSRTQSWRERLGESGQLSVILVAALLVINLTYGFEDTFREMKEYSFVSATLRGTEGEAEPGTDLATGNRLRTSWLGRIPVPLPANYVCGIDQTKWEFETGRWSYLAGEWRMGGWWYYYLYAAAIKVPLGSWLLLLAASLVVGMAPRRYGAYGRCEAMLLATPLIVMILVSSQTGFNHHLRYVIPAFPFVYVWMSRLGRSLALRHSHLFSVLIVCLAWSIGSSFWIYPHSMSYFNELVGGPSRGHYFLGGGSLRPQGSPDSNIDWGQDLLYLKRWLEEHPEAGPIHVAFNGICDPKLAGIEYQEVPLDPRYRMMAGTAAGAAQGPRPGWYAISVNKLHTREMAYSYFLDLTPRDRVGYSILIYHITVEQANHLRLRDASP